MRCEIVMRCDTKSLAKRIHQDLASDFLAVLSHRSPKKSGPKRPSAHSARGRYSDLLIVRFAFALADPRIAVRFARVEWVDVLVPRDGLQLLFVVDEVVFRVAGELEVLG